MISSEAPLIFSKACEIFILELTMRAWVHTEENKRRTLQKSDVAMALTKADMYDCTYFRIDFNHYCSRANSQHASPYRHCAPGNTNGRSHVLATNHEGDFSMS